MKIKITVAISVVLIGLVVFWFWLWPFGDAFTRDYDRTIDEVVRIVDENPTTEGVDKASEYYSKSLQRLHDEMNFQNDTIDPYLKCIDRNRTKIFGLGERHPELKRQIDLLGHVVYESTKGGRIHL